jgi:hypothetical protein
MTTDMPASCLQLGHSGVHRLYATCCATLRSDRRELTPLRFIEVLTWKYRGLIHLNIFVASAFAPLRAVTSCPGAVAGSCDVDTAHEHQIKLVVKFSTECNWDAKQPDGDS